ncbi:MAG: hypothetical protein JW866_03460 [Ignavibacteriales bacterium]|nr:hypothetical protein [Ignavibacteriales bacterium]
MKRTKYLKVLMCIFIFSTFVYSQSTKNDIPVSQLPSSIKNILDKYVEILNSETLNICAEKFLSIAGGSLVNPEGTSLRSTVKPFSLTKDFNNIKFYKQPVEITRVNVQYSNGAGFGQSAIKGKIYKIWIQKKDNVQGLPAPVSIMIPEGHPTIKEPKVINIGSF